MLFQNRKRSCGLTAGHQTFNLASLGANPGKHHTYRHEQFIEENDIRNTR